MHSNVSFMQVNFARYNIMLWNITDIVNCLFDIWLLLEYFSVHRYLFRINVTGLYLKIIDRACNELWSGSWVLSGKFCGESSRQQFRNANIQRSLKQIPEKKTKNIRPVQQNLGFGLEGSFTPTLSIRMILPA